MKQVILLKLGEVVLKGQNRYRFEQLLLKNIRQALADIGPVELRSIQSTIYVQPQDETVIDAALRRLECVFGIVGLTKAAVCSYDMQDVCRTAREYLKYDLLQAKTFKVEAKRADKSFPLTSPQISRALADDLAEHNPHLNADMKNPDITVYAEVREGHVYVHKTQLRGAGGLPCGCGGNGLLMLSGGLDSPVAGYLMARRGMRIFAIHFESPPYTSVQARMKVEKLAGLLGRYGGTVPLFVVHFTQIQEQIRSLCREDLFTVIMRRFMLRIACRIAERISAQAIITGESLGQVASQTLQAIVCTDAVSDRPVFRPCIGMDKSDIIDISYKIGTYKTSVEPYQDCCTVFTPRHPKTKPSLEEILRQEEKLDIAALLDAAEVERIDVKPL